MRKVLRFALTALVLVVVGVLFGRALAENWAEVQAAELAFHPAMILGLVLFALAVPVYLRIQACAGQTCGAQ